MVALLDSTFQYIEGNVEQGKQLGRTIGFPTANIKVPVRNIPKNGVYGVEAFLNGK